MIAPTFVLTALLAASSFPLPSLARHSDACAKVGGKTYVAPADALACQRSFAANETLKQNVLTVADRVFNFYTFEDYYLNSPAPFQGSTVNIRQELARINSTKYETDFDFNKDLYDLVNGLNDGHTLWIMNCYSTYQNILPAPIVQLEENGTQAIYVAPDSVQFLSQLGSNFTDYFDALKFDWKALAGAKVLSIEGQDPYAYVDHIADTVSGNYLDHNIRVNSVFSSYRIQNNDFSQRLGDLAGPSFPTLDSLTFSLLPVNKTSPVNVTVPYVASLTGKAFTDKKSYWANNCAVTNTTNGVDYKSSSKNFEEGNISPRRKLARGVFRDKAPVSAVGLPDPFRPTLKQQKGSTGVIKNYILPDNKTGVMFIGSFEGDYNQFQTDTVAAIAAFKKKGVSQLLIDVSNNGGGYVCLGLFLHRYLSGESLGYAGFQSTSRANPLAQKIVKNGIKLGLNSSLSYYAPDNWAFLNNTQMPDSYDYNNPDTSITINGQQDVISQRFHDVCTPFQVPLPKAAPFDLKNVAIVGNGNCASTCAMFTTLMFERHNTTIVGFGGKAGEELQYKGMSGNQVLEWADLDSEVKTANLKDDPLAAPDLLVNADLRHNWRTAWSYLDESKPIAYVSEQPQVRFQYTKETYNNPQKLWEFTAGKVFP